MSDTGDSVMEEIERKRLKRAIDGARGKDVDQQIIYIREGGKKEDGFGRLKDAVFVTVVLAMGGVTWTQSISQAAINAKLETTVENLGKTVSELTQEVKTLQARIKP